MKRNKESSVSVPTESDELTSSGLQKKQSVRANFRLPEEIINLLSIVALQLGLKQKSLLDQLVEDGELLDRLAEKKISEGNLERKRVRPKTFVISKNSLQTLDNIAREKNISRDVLVEISIQRLIPVLSSEHRKQMKRKKMHAELDLFLQQGEKLLNKASKLMAKEDDYYKILERTIEMCRGSYRELNSIVTKGKAMEKFNYPD